MSFNYHLSQWSKKPAVWVGGVVLTAAIIYAALDDSSPRRGYSVFPNYVPETSPIRPRGGLAPGSAYSEGRDSLAMAGGMSEAASPAALSHKGDFIAALNEIEQESKRKKKKKKGIVARLKAAFSKWGGASGSSSVSLSAPQNLVKRRRVGAGRLNRVDSSPEYRAAYRDAARKKAGKVRDSVRGDGILARAGEKAIKAFKSLLPGKLHGKEGPGAGLDGGEADGQPGATPQSPEKPEGAPTEEQPKGKEGEGSGSGSQPSMGSPSGGGAGNNNSNNNNDNRPGGRKSGLDIGVSKAGFSGDTEAQVRYGNALKEAGSSANNELGNGTTRPGYKGDTRMAQAKSDKTMLDDISKYKPAPVMTAVGNAKGAPTPATALTDPNVLKDVDLQNYPTKTITQTVEGGIGDLKTATQQAEAYKAALAKAAGNVEGQSTATDELSARILKHRDALNTGERTLQTLGTDIGQQGTAWDNVPPGESQTATRGSMFPAQTQPLITNYGAGVKKLITEGEGASKAAETRLTAAKGSYQTVTQDLNTAAQNLQTSITHLNGKIAGMRAESVAMKNSTAGRLEATTTPFNQMRSKYDGTVENVVNARNVLVEDQKTYNSLSEALKNASCALVEALKKTCN